MPHIHVEPVTTTTADGVRLHLRRFVPPGQRRAVCLCTHAMMANGSYFGSSTRGLACELALSGVEVFVLDWRGHGRSEPRAGDADWCFDDYVELDLPAAIQTTCQIADIDASGLGYVGHSLGGLVALAALGTGTVPLLNRLSLWATTVWLPGPGGSLRRRAIMRAFSWASHPLGYLPARLLRLGSDNEARGFADQMAGWALRGRWTRRDGADYSRFLCEVSPPVWAVMGAGDRLASVRDAEHLRSQLPNAHPLRVVGRTNGDALDADHFSLLTHPRMKPVWRELTRFLTA